MNKSIPFFLMFLITLAIIDSINTKKFMAEKNNSTSLSTMSTKQTGSGTTFSFHWVGTGTIKTINFPLNAETASKIQAKEFLFAFCGDHLNCGAFTFTSESGEIIN